MSDTQCELHGRELDCPSCRSARAGATKSERKSNAARINARKGGRSPTRMIDVAAVLPVDDYQEWWSALAADVQAGCDIPTCLVNLLATDHQVATRSQADRARVYAKRLPGWADGPTGEHPLYFTELKEPTT